MKLKRMVTAILAVTMALSLLVLSGCKEKESDGGNIHTTEGPQFNEEDLENLDISGVHFELDARVYARGILQVPVDTSVVRGAVATGSFEFYSSDSNGAAIIPITSVTPGTVITVPITYDGVELSLLAYAVDYSDMYFVSLNVSTLHGLHTAQGDPTSAGFSQVLFQDSTEYIVCNECGQVFAPTIMGVGEETGLMYCRPIRINPESYYLTLANESTAKYNEVYPWISDEETGNYSAGVPYVTAASINGQHCIVVPQEAIAECYNQLMEWEQAAQSALNVPDDADVIPSYSDPNSIPTVDNNGLDEIPTVD